MFKEEKLGLVLHLRQAEGMPNEFLLRPSPQRDRGQPPWQYLSGNETVHIAPLSSDWVRDGEGKRKNVIGIFCSNFLKMEFSERQRHLKHVPLSLL